MIEGRLGRTSRDEVLAALRARSPAVLPSLLLCDFGHLAGEIARLEAAGVGALHLDVMDGHFVPNLSYGLPIVEAVRRLTSLPLDVHLMIADPARYAEAFARAGANLMSIHVEAVAEPVGVLGQIRSLGVAAGLALNPRTPLEAIEPALAACDYVLVMSVEPGFGGQPFEPVALSKLRRLRELVGRDRLLEVDGGVAADNVAEATAAGADLLVVGSAIFRQPDYSVAVGRLSDLARANRRQQTQQC